MPSSPAAPGPKPKGCLRGLFREIIMPLGMAMVVILFVIQAFKIPSASMEKTLLVGDFLLGLKLPYGAEIPFTHWKTPAFLDPKPGDILIFKYPGDPDVPENNPARYRFVANLFLFGVLYWDSQPKPGQSHLVVYQRKDFIKRCVAQSGQTLRVEGTDVFVDEKQMALPRHGQYESDRGFDPIRDKLSFRLPKPGETLRLDTLSLRMAMWMRSLALQENPGHKVELVLDLLKDSAVANDYVLPYLNGDPQNRHHLNLFVLMDIPAVRAVAGQVEFLHAENVPFTAIREAAKTGFVRSTDLMYPEGQSGLTRTETSEYLLPNYFDLIEQNLQGQGQAMGASLKLRASLSIDGKVSPSYTLRQKCYFMMGDNRDNSSDGRYWGMLSREFVKAKAAIIYFSFENGDGRFQLTNPVTWPRIPFRIRYDRVGKLIE